MDAITISKQVVKRAFDLLDHYGLGPEMATEIQQEAAALSMVLLDADASPEAKDAARKALESIPLRIKQNAVGMRADIVFRLRTVGEALVRVLLGLSDLSFR